MGPIARQVAREAKAMTKQEVITKAIEGRITWLQAADILGMTPRHLRRMRDGYRRWGVEVFVDRRGKGARPRRIARETIAELCRLRKETYRDFSVRHFYEFATEKHGLELSYSWALRVLQDAGLAAKTPGRGQYRRKRERRPMVGMLLHLDASTHRWLDGQPMQDLVVMLDDADGQILYARFVPQEGVSSTFAALRHVLMHYGRFAELYTDRGSHFCRTGKAGEDPDQDQQGQVPRALKALGIRQILARSPEARGRSERAFGTIQGRLPQELRLAGIRSYGQANAYLEAKFIADFNRRFTVNPAQPESAFVRLVGVDLRLLLSTQHERVVRNDNTVQFGGLSLQLPRRRDRTHFARCPVLVHELANETLGISYQGRLLARFNQDGALSESPSANRARGHL